MGEGTVVAADGMPLQVGDKVVDENGNAFKVVSFTKEKASGKSFVLCKKKGFLDETVCCSVFLPEEIVHAPSWWPWWRRGAE